MSGRRTIRREGCAALLATAAALVQLDARAAGAIASSPAGTAAISAAKIAVTASSAWSTRWATIRIEGSPAVVGWILPVRPGGRVDETSDAWIEALEAATAPRILPPLGCTGPVASVAPIAEGDLDHHPTIPALHVEVIADTDSLDRFGIDWGLSIDPATRDRWQTMTAAGWLAVAMIYGPSGAPFWTRTVRINDDAAPFLPLGLTSASGAPVRVTAFAIGEHRSTVGDTPPIAIPYDRVAFDSSGPSSYAVLRDGLLAGATGSFAIEAAGIDFFWQGIPAPGGVPAAAPPIVGTYLERAAGYADVAGSTDGCTANMLRWSSSRMPVGTACADGTLARTAEAATDRGCVESLSAGTIAPSVFRCAGADDLAFAFSGLDPWSTFVTRFAEVIAPSQSGRDAAVNPTSDQMQSPFIVAGSGVSACIPIPPITTPPPVDPTWPPSDPIPPPDPYPPSTDFGVTIDSGASDGASSGCSGSSSDAARSDDASSSDDSGGCDGSSDDSSSDDSGCGSSSRGSEPEQDEDSGCDSSPQKDPDQEEASNDGCSSSHTSSSDGQDNSCDVARRHRRGHRSRTFPFALALCAAALPMRRALRRRRPQVTARSETNDTTASTTEGATSTPL